MSFRKITKPIKSFSSLPSTYSVGRLQARATPFGTEVALRSSMTLGVASSGARSSPFLPQPKKKRTGISARATKALILCPQFLQPPHDIAPSSAPESATTIDNRFGRQKVIDVFLDSFRKPLEIFQ